MPANVPPTGAFSSEFTGLLTTEFGTGMRLAMCVSQSLGRPAADFVDASTW